MRPGTLPVPGLSAPGPAAVTRDELSLPGERALVVVSNRLPFTVERRPEGIRFTRSPGGLVAALDPVLEQRGGVWVGWPGLEQEPEDHGATLVPPAGTRVRYRPVNLSGREVSAYYGGFSN